jgi:hypothetical protein
VRVLKLKNKYRKICMMIIIASLLLSSHVLAAGDNNSDQELQLEIYYKINNTILVGAQFDLYLVATIDDNGNVTTTSKFGLYSDDIADIVANQDTMDEELINLTTLLEEYISLNSDRITSIDTGVTDQKGRLTFPTGDDKLVDGLYLVIGHSLTQNGYTYNASSFMTFLPMTDNDGEVWQYITAMPKADYTKIPGPNNPPDNPTPNTPSDTPSGGGTPVIYSGRTLTGPTLSGAVETRGETSPIEPGLTLSGSLPQTGQLWWPVPLLLSIGLVLIIIGLVRRRNMDGE